MKARIFKIMPLILGLGMVTCQSSEELPDDTMNSSPVALFEKIEDSGVDFTNTLTYDEDFNIFTYRNFYNGGGVGLADVNNDGLTDIYLIGNQLPNRLYLNRGNMKFEDVTEQAGVAGQRAWSTGVSMADINGDGLVDIYVCNSGDVAGDNKQNELFINNGDGTFSEKAEEYGLADKGYSTHAAFFDYDGDGDLDIYLLNNSYQAIGSFNLMKNIRPERDPVGGDKLYRNDGNVFTDVSEEAGIYGSIIGFGLGVSIGDVNQDGWYDIFVSNDFFERDYLYLNNGDGTFTERLQAQMRSISAASMGADMADINNDGLLDIFVTDMLPEPLERMKQVTTFESWDKFSYNVSNDYHHQYNRNMLHLNNGDGTFSEIGRFANVEATDWSWGALFFDMDNDGHKDIFVANGIYQDLTDLDYLNFISDDETKKKIISQSGVDYKGLIDPMPVTPIPNYAFHNNGNLTFTNRAADWGLGKPVHSNGSAYADLDNDGDLDLVVNNVNAESDIFENKANEVFPEHNFLKITFLGKGKNTQAIGTKVWVTSGNETIYHELMPVRGFESTVESGLTIGLGEVDTVTSLRIVWPDRKTTQLDNVVANQTLTLDWTKATQEYVYEEIAEPTLLKRTESPFTWRHQENDFVDFDRDRLTYHMRSNEGPAFARADINNDGLEDIYLGGAKDQPGVLLVQQPDGSFKETHVELFVTDKRSEDIDAVFADFDGDGDPDLYVASGGNEFGYGDLSLRDRLYINDKGKFTKKSVAILSSLTTPTSQVVPLDFDKDGDLDLFVFERLVPFKYGLPASGHVLENDGKANFKEVTKEVAPSLDKVGMVTAVIASDYDHDDDIDLILVGEWIAPIILENKGGTFSSNEKNDFSAHHGWYNAIESADLDGDGDMDYILGNHGTNSRFKASKDFPVSLFIHDFDRNGAIDQIMTKQQEDGSTYPYTLKHDLVMQMPSLKKKYLKYTNYNSESMEDIFTGEELNDALVLQANSFETAIMINEGSGKFTIKALPESAQFSPVYAIEMMDVNDDGLPDIILGGNLFRAKPEAGRYDASYGLVLLNKGDMNFESLSANKSGLRLEGEIRQIETVEWKGKKSVWIIRNNDTVEVYE